MTGDMVLFLDAQAEVDRYIAIARDDQGNVVTHCSHRHRNRRTAETCARTWLRDAMRVAPIQVVERFDNRDER